MINFENNFTISEVLAKPEFFGKTLQELDTIDTYRLTLITIIRSKEKRNLIGKKTIIKESIGLLNFHVLNMCR